MNNNIYERFEERIAAKKAAEQLFPATLSFKILGKNAEDAQMTLEALIENLGKFSDMRDVKGEME